MTAELPAAAARVSAPPRAAGWRGGGIRLRVLVASASATLRLAAHSLAEEPDLACSIETPAGAASLFAALQRQQPRLLLLDEDHYEALEPADRARLRSAVPGLRIVLVCAQLRPGLAERVLRCRMHGFVPARAPASALARVIRAVGAGELWFPRALLSQAVSQWMQGGTIVDADPCSTCAEAGERCALLTRREAQIVGFIREGLTNKEIARRLGIMEDTVKKHLQAVFGKLGVRRRALVALNTPPLGAA